MPPQRTSSCSSPALGASPVAIFLAAWLLQILSAERALADRASSHRATHTTSSLGAAVKGQRR